MSSLKQPNEKLFKKWRDQYSFGSKLNENKTMICTVCVSQEDKIRSMPNVSTSFISGSTNYRLSSIKDHDSSECHKRACREKEYATAVALGKSVAPRKVVLQAPADSAIVKGFTQMGDQERESVQKLQEIAFHIARKGRPFTDFQDQVEIEKLHGVKYTGTYENETACKNFIFCIAEYLFEQETRKKLELVNFVAILCDGSTDKSITEQEVVYVIYTDPETFQTTMKFFEVIAPSESQDAPGLKQAIIDAFKRHSLESVLSKLVFLSSDGASVNCGKNSGLIRLFQNDYPWMAFIWCFSHRLELALKDALKEFIEPVETSLRHLYYLYSNSSKKHRELKNLYMLLKGQFEMYSASVRPVKATGTRWIDHKLRAMDRFIEKFGIYAQHLQHVISTTSNSKDRATLEGKFTKLVDAKVLLRSAFFTDVLAEAKKFSLNTQRSNINIITIIDHVEETKHNYERLLKKLRRNPAFVFELPTLKLVIEAIESNEEDGEPLYQNQKVHYYAREKRFLENHSIEIVEAIIACFERRYGHLYCDTNDNDVNVNSDEGDRVLFDVCRILNCNVWPEITAGSDLEETFSVQLTSFGKLFNRYNDMEVFMGLTSDNVISSFLDIVRYASRYFNTSNISPIDFWSKILQLREEKSSWKAALCWLSSVFVHHFQTLPWRGCSAI